MGESVTKEVADQVLVRMVSESKISRSELDLFVKRRPHLTLLDVATPFYARLDMRDLPVGKCSLCGLIVLGHEPHFYRDGSTESSRSPIECLCCMKTGQYVSFLVLREDEDARLPDRYVGNGEDHPAVSFEMARRWAFEDAEAFVDAYSTGLRSAWICVHDGAADPSQRIRLEY